ncbi:TetR/AcrR family transcriptional regulator [Mycobacterium sp. BMJ-28]
MTTAAGRPRDPAKDVAVLQATRELLVEKGYQDTTMVAIAKRAGVGAPTLYRRWPSKEALVEDAAFGPTDSVPAPAATGDLYRDLRGWVAMFLNRLADPVTRAALPGLLTAYHHDESIYERLVLRAEADVRVMMTELLGDSDRANTVFDFLVATTVVRAMTRGLAGCDAFCDRTAAALTALARAEIARR